MAHMIETMAYAGATPWHGLGEQVDPSLSSLEMLKAAGLDWSVEKQAMVTGDLLDIRMPDHYALIRSFSDGRKDVLGICGKDYQVTQNEKAFEFFNEFVTSGGMEMHTAGALNGGRRVWGLASIKQGFTLPGGDEVHGFLLLSHPHIWGEALRVMFTTVRVVCNNTLTYALARSGGFRMTHSYVFDDDMQLKAKETLGLAVEQLEQAEAVSRKLASTKATDEMLNSFLTKLFPKPDADNDELNRTGKLVLDALKTQPGAEMESSAGTMWGALNAVTYVVDHKLGRTAEGRLENAWFGSRAELKRKAVSTAMELALAA